MPELELDADVTSNGAFGVHLLPIPTLPHLIMTSPPSNQPAYDIALPVPFRPPLANKPAPPPEFTPSEFAPLPPIATIPAPPPP